MTQPTPTIELPRLDGESSRAYQARTEYILAGPGRDLRSLAQRLDKSLTIVGRWSKQYEWVELAARYDQDMVRLATDQAAAAYRADLADYRKRYSEMGKGLYQAAALLTRRIIKETAEMEIGPGTLALAANAAKTAADLEALALRVEDLLRESGSE